MTDRPTPETDAMASMRRATSEWITLSSKLERERDEARAQRNTLAEALDGLMDEYTDRKAQWGSEYLWEKHECAEVIETAREAIAAVKGGMP